LQEIYMIGSKQISAALLSLVMATSAIPAYALPVMAKPAADSAVQTVGYRGGHYNRGGHGYRHGGYGYGRHRGIGAGAVIGGLVAGALIAGAIREGRAGGSDITRCEEAYQSFDPASGTYLGYDGERHVCPYLE
jgi:BA14K-like protein